MWLKFDTFSFIQLAPDQGVQSMDPSTGVKRRCDEEAARVVQENNVGLYVMLKILHVHVQTIHDKNTM